MWQGCVLFMKLLQTRCIIFGSPELPLLLVDHSRVQTEVCAPKETNMKYHFKELHKQWSTNESSSLKGRNLISIILRDYKLNPHTNTRKTHV